MVNVQWGSVNFKVLARHNAHSYYQIIHTTHIHSGIRIISFRSLIQALTLVHNQPDSLQHIHRLLSLSLIHSNILDVTLFDYTLFRTTGHTWSIKLVEVGQLHTVITFIDYSKKQWPIGDTHELQ